MRGHTKESDTLQRQERKARERGEYIEEGCGCGCGCGKMRDAKASKAKHTKQSLGIATCHMPHATAMHGGIYNT
jgi:uncharacterized protein YutD